MEEDYRDSACEAFSSLTPEERAEFVRQLREESLQWGCDLSGREAEEVDNRFEDPDYLAQMTGRVHREQTELLKSLLMGGRTTSWAA